MRGRHTGYSVDRLLAILNALKVDIDYHHPPKTPWQNRPSRYRQIDEKGQCLN